MLVAGDLLASALAYLAAWGIRVLVPLPLTSGFIPAVRFDEVQHHWPEMALVQLGALFFLGLYETRALLRPRDHLGATVAAGVVQALALIAGYFFRSDLVFPRSIFLLHAGLDAALLMLWRLACSPLLHRYPRRRVLVVGADHAAAEVVAAIRGQHWLGMDVVGLVSSNGRPPPPIDGVPLVGNRSELPLLCTRFDIDEVIIASEPSWQDLLLDEFSRWEGTRARLYIVPTPFEMLIGRPEHLRLHDIPLIEVNRDAVGGGSTFTKRAFDVLLAIALAIITTPVLLLVAAAIRLSSKGPVLYRQARVGKDGSAFTMVKLRTMRVDAERLSGPVMAAANDPRVTALGRILRATRLDELPQLLNVLRGEMSFVGPRPERPEFVRSFAESIQGYRERLKVRPGLTGYAQVNGEYHTSAATKLKYDLAYIHNRSLWLDCKILASTVKVMLTRRGV
jgi:exopolysaccharide biosynthesis polyprenyl glycosylphosphotransferase